jgi:hypothetical protein
MIFLGYGLSRLTNFSYFLVCHISVDRIKEKAIDKLSFLKNRSLNFKQFHQNLIFLSRFKQMWVILGKILLTNFNLIWSPIEYKIYSNMFINADLTIFIPF